MYEEEEGLMEALSAIAGSVGTRKGGEMTLGLTTTRQRSSSPAGSSPGSSRTASPPPSGRTGSSRSGILSPRQGAVTAAPALAMQKLDAMRTPRPVQSPRALVPGDGAMVAYTDEYTWPQETQAMHKTVKALPQKGNPMALLCQATRDVLDAHDALLDDHLFDRFERWAETIYRGALQTDIKVDSNKTTLGLVLLDDAVELVLPGGPAFNAGIKKGDCILTVSVL